MGVDAVRSARGRLVTRYGWLIVRALDRFFARQSLVGDAPVPDGRHFPFTAELGASWEAIRDEVVAILRHRDAVPAFHDISPEQRYISQGDEWRTFFLYGFGTKLEGNCSYAPVTALVLDRIPGLQTAWFSILAPGSHIPAHGGVSKSLLRAHLGLVVPADAERCRMRVDDRVLAWRPGEVFVFDDTAEHEVWNDTAEERVVLVIDIDRPMRRPGRLLHGLFLRLVKRTAFYREPERRMIELEARFAAAVAQDASVRPDRS